MDPVRKARSDSWWAALPEEEAWEIFEKRRRLPWHAVAKWLREAKGLDVSRRALERFEAWMRPQVASRRVELAVLARNEARDLAAAAGAREDVANAFLAMASEIALRTEDPSAAGEWMRMFADVVKAAQKDAQLKQHAEDSRFAREKFEFDAAKAVLEKAASLRAISADNDLSADAKIAAVRTELFGEAAG